MQSYGGRKEKGKLNVKDKRGKKGGRRKQEWPLGCLVLIVEYNLAPRRMVSMKNCLDQVVLWVRVRDCLDTLVNMKRPSLQAGSSFPDSKCRALAEH